ncbi:MAG: acyl transferase [Bacteroidetes bacterium]|nr:acyl transferase [Bacteroidota bacterium]
MKSAEDIKSRLFNTESQFTDLCHEVFEYQQELVPIYKQFAHQLDQTRPSKESITTYPFLPIEFFRSRQLIATTKTQQLFFESSGTTSENNSRHYIADPDIYHSSIVKGFELFYGPVEDHVFFALLPSYLEREHASLVYMSGHLMQASGTNDGGFYKFTYKELIQDIKNYKGKRKIVLIGVTFALWDMAELDAPPDFSNVIILETGGMKGRRREIIREELHHLLNKAFSTKDIHSEYGMTELLSQAYSKENGVFHCPPWMKVLVRDPYDPLQVSNSGKGVLNVIDLANLHSCSFIATNDLGEVFKDGSFTVTGRIDNSRLRGCNLMFP